MVAPRTLSDNQGTIVAGPLSPEVYYLRIVGEVSPTLGLRCASVLRQHFAETTANHMIFLDVKDARGSHLIARSAIMQVLLSKRRQLTSITILVSTGDVQMRAQAMAEMLVSRIQIVDSLTVFQARLQSVAPTADAAIPASGRIPVVRSLHPVARSYRPRIRTGTQG